MNTVIEEFKKKQEKELAQKYEEIEILATLGIEYGKARVSFCDLFGVHARILIKAKYSFENALELIKRIQDNVMGPARMVERKEACLSFVTHEWISKQKKGEREWRLPILPIKFTLNEFEQKITYYGELYGVTYAICIEVESFSPIITVEEEIKDKKLIATHLHNDIRIINMGTDDDEELCLHKVHRMWSSNNGPSKNFEIVYNDTATSTKFDVRNFVRAVREPT